MEIKGKVNVYDINYIVNKFSSLFNELLGYIDLGKISLGNYI